MYKSELFVNGFFSKKWLNPWIEKPLAKESFFCIKILKYASKINNGPFFDGYLEILGRKSWRRAIFKTLIDLYKALQEHDFIRGKANGWAFLTEKKSTYFVSIKMEESHQSQNQIM